MAVIKISSISETNQFHRLDAEFYQPQYEIDFTKGDWPKIKKFTRKSQYGISQAMHEEPKGYPIFKMDNIEECFLRTENTKYINISNSKFNEFKLEKNDVLFNRVNSDQFVGRTGIFKLDGDFVFASYLIRLQMKQKSEIKPDYLNLFLNSKYGKKQIHRFKRRAVNQANVNAQELKNFRIFKFEEKKQIAFQNDVNNAWKKLDESISSYNSALELLLKKTNLENYKINYKKSYISNLSNTITNHRLDPEFYQPLYKLILKHIKTLPTEKLEKLAKRKTIKIFPEQNKFYKYIEIGDVETDIGEVNFTERLGKDLPPNARIPINGGELIISKVRPTRGAIGIIPEDIGENTICSSAFSVFDIPSPLKEFIYIVIRSKIGLLQLEKASTGTEYPTILDKVVENIWIPLLDDITQSKISSLVIKLYKLKRESSKILQDTINRIEQEIDKIVQPQNI